MGGGFSCIFEALAKQKKLLLLKICSLNLKALSITASGKVQGKKKNPSKESNSLAYLLTCLLSQLFSQNKICTLHVVLLHGRAKDQRNHSANTS